MNCKETIHELSAYLDNEVSAPVRRAIEAHVGSCDGCRARLDELRRLSAGIAALPSVPVSDDLARAVRRRIRQGDASPAADSSWWERFIQPGWFKIPLQATALLAVFIGIAMLVRTYRETPSTEMAQAKQSAPFDSQVPVIVGNESKLTDWSADKLAEADGRTTSGEFEGGAKKETFAVDTLSRAKGDRGYTAVAPAPLPAPTAPPTPENKPSPDTHRHAQTAPPMPSVAAKEPAEESNATPKVQARLVETERKQLEEHGDKVGHAEIQTEANVLLVASNDAPAILQQATALASRFDGRLVAALRQSVADAKTKDAAPAGGIVLQDRDDLAVNNTISIELPSSQVTAFKNELTASLATRRERAEKLSATMQPADEKNAVAKSGAETRANQAGSGSRSLGFGATTGKDITAPKPATPAATNAVLAAELPAGPPATTADASAVAQPQTAPASSRPVLAGAIEKSPVAPPSTLAESDRIILIIKVVPASP